MKVSKVTILSSGIPMEYIREMKFYMELGMECNAVLCTAVDAALFKRRMFRLLGAE